MKVIIHVAVITTMVFVMGGCAAGEGSGLRGESCENRADCSGGLACVSEVCIVDTHNLTANGMICHTLECGVSGDCDDNASCIDDLCVDTCTSNDDCYGYACVGGLCRQCSTNNDCATSGERCVDNACYRECSNTGECPVFYQCNSGLCERRGCQNNTQCIFNTFNTESVCQATGYCAMSCQSDRHCGYFEVCAAGACQTAGCTSETDCKAAMYPAGYPDGIMGMECVAAPTSTGPVYASANVIIQEEPVGPPGFSGCEEDQIMCLDGSGCIPIDWYCDGMADCNDGSDEPAGCGY